MRTFFRRRSAAVAVGVLVLALTGGGVAVASARQADQPGPVAPAPPPLTPQKALQLQPPEFGPKGPPRRRDFAPQLTGATLSALVDRDGTLVRGFHAASAVRVGVGQYKVNFDQDVSGGVYVATLGLPGNQFVPPPGEIGVTGRIDSVNGVFIQTYSSVGVASDLAFYLVVVN